MYSTCALVAVLISATSSVTTGDVDAMSKRAALQRNACGPIAVAFCLQRIGYDQPVGRVLRASPVNEGGMSLDDISSLIQKCQPGITAHLAKVDKSSLRTLPVPSILILNHHCVVYDGPSNDDSHLVNIFDPARMRTLEIDEHEVDHLWTGVVITFEDGWFAGRANIVLLILNALEFTLLAMWFVRYKSFGKKVDVSVA